MNDYIKPGTPCNLHQHVATISKRSSFISSHLPSAENDYILDIGTGCGVYLDYLSQDAKLCIGVDINNKGFNKIEKASDIELAVATAEALPFNACSFDAIIMIEVLEHIIDDKKAIEECYRVLKPGGHLIITAPNKLFPFETHGVRIGSKNFGTMGFGFPILPYLPEAIRKDFANAKVYSPKVLQKMLIERGFTIKVVEFLVPGFDQIGVFFPRMLKYVEIIKKLTQSVEKNELLKQFLATIIILAEKPNHYSDLDAPENENLKRSRRPFHAKE